MTPEQQYVLNTIAAGESPDYSTIYGGHKFKGFASHPGIAVPIPGSSFSSTAAGRYQMLEKTWKEQAEKLGLKDFSPESQDAAAWNLAQETYAKQTGRSLSEDASRHEVDWGALTRQWPSLMRFVDPEKAPGAAGLGAQIAGGSVPQNVDPMIFQQLPLGQSSGPRLTPVDFDPFQRNQR